MAKRQLYTGYTRHNSRQPLHPCPNQTSSKEIQWLVNMVSNYFWTAYSIMSVNYLAIATVFVVVLLSFVIPDISQKVHASNELKDMKKFLDIMSKEVNRAEVACLTAADEICCLRCSMHDGATETFQGLPDISICASHCMRTTQSEPVQVEKKIGFFRRILHPYGNTSHKEIAIMSYVYTDSFDAEKKMKNNITQLF